MKLLLFIHNADNTLTLTFLTPAKNTVSGKEVRLEIGI
jgi:hypothetical protein